MKRFPNVFLRTGHGLAAVRPVAVTTVLGSCVAVTMSCPARGIGLICHAFLPDSRETARGGRGFRPCRFVDTAVERMFESLARLRVRPASLLIKVFGGADGPAANLGCGVGASNLAAVERVLAGRGLRAAARDVGGPFGRTIRFLTHTGQVFVKRIPLPDADLPAPARTPFGGVAP